MIWVVSFHILWINICQGDSYSLCYGIFFNMKHKYLYCVKFCVHMRKKNLVMSRGTMWPDMGIQGIAGNRGSKEGEEDMLLSLFLFSCYVRAHRHSLNQVWTPPYRISLSGHLTLTVDPTSCSALGTGVLSLEPCVCSSTSAYITWMVLRLPICSAFSS